MQCNIDAKGKAVRLMSGLVSVAAGLFSLALWATGMVANGWVGVVGGALVAIGGFQIFEGWAGWCVVRAMGFKTKV